VVGLLVEKEADVESEDEDGQKPLLIDAANGHEGVVRLLLAKDGVNPDSEESRRRTPLWWAGQKGHEAVIKLLLEKGADVESKGKYD
jgi:ankyrin repeat protein